MILPEFFFEALKSNDINFFCGVPDSLLKDICAYITDHADGARHIIASNEGAAIGLATGYHLATNLIPLVYMQNSGLGNTVNPILSLADPEVYSIPMILLIGWRGEPGIKDEPQHVKQGKVTDKLLDALGIKFYILSENGEVAKQQIDDSINYAKQNNAPCALIVRKETFSEYKLIKTDNDLSHLSREDAIKKIAFNLDKTDIVVSTTGMISRELYESREILGDGHEKDFLTVGAMGHANQIALGIALTKRDRKIVCLDGDGAALMHMGSMGIIGNIAPENFIHIILNNGAHDSVGGQPTVGHSISFTKVALACGYKKAISISTENEIDATLSQLNEGCGPILIEIKVRKGNRPDLGRPKVSPIMSKISFMDNIK